MVTQHPACNTVLYHMLPAPQGAKSGRQTATPYLYPAADLESQVMHVLSTYKCAT